MKSRNEKGISGKAAEAEVFDSVSEEYEKYGEGEYFNFRTSMAMVKESQPFADPSDPETPFANDLHASVAELLGLENYGQLKFYTAISSHLDFYHGVDAFFELDLGGGNTITATLDVTVNPNKTAHKADVVFFWPNVDRKLKEDREEWADVVNKVAEQVVDILREKAENANRMILSLSEYEIEESDNMSRSRTAQLLPRLSKKLSG